MSAHRTSSLQKILAKISKDERGQLLPMVALMLVVLMGFAGLVIDVGRAYVSYRELQAATDAAALAGAQSLPDNVAATAAVTAYSAVSGNKNAVPNISGATIVTGYPQFKCLTTLNLPCIAPANANAVVVQQTVKLKMTFAALVGYKEMPLTTTATAAMRGAIAAPYNVAIVVDTTASMQSTDSDSSCNASRISCALNGIQILLQNMNPCAASSTTCGAASNGNVSNPVDKVSIFTYPNVQTTTASNDYNCSGSNPTVSAYTFPSATGVTYTPGTSTYQIVNYSSDYKSSNSTTTLSTSSDLTAAIGDGPSTTTTTTSHGHTTTTTTPCPGMQAPGGEGTFFAGAIYAAQASLVAAKVANPKAQNVMIILSDGDASASSSAMPGASTTSGVYPSTKNQCQQAVTAAAAAKTGGTKVYTVAYGANTSGCSTDSPAISPCQTMQNMAYDASTFFSDYTATGGSSSCISAAEPVSALSSIFTKIAGDLTLSRLIPDNTQ